MIGDTTLATHRVRYSAAYPTGRERLQTHQRGQAHGCHPRGRRLATPRGNPLLPLGVRINDMRRDKSKGLWPVEDGNMRCEFVDGGTMGGKTTVVIYCGNHV